MRLGLIAVILALTGLVFFSSIQSQATASGADTVTQVEAENLQLHADRVELENEAATLAVRIADLEGQIAESNSTREALTAKLASFDSLSTEAQDLTSENARLTQSVMTAQTELAQLQTALSETEAALEATTQDLAAQTERLELLDAQNAELQASLLATSEQDGASEVLEYEAQLASLQSMLDEKDIALASADDFIAELSNDIKSANLLQSDLDQLMLQLGATESVLAARDAEIAQLQSATGLATETPKAICQEQFDTLLVEQSVEFEPGTTTLAATAMPILESAASMAISCAQVGLRLEIEGHTHSDGGEASNLLLSNGRANVVYAFLMDKGVPSDAMRPVGFGESDPIADNATLEGQQINQRIAFAWEQN